jgi:hypothetical protein
MRRTLLPLSGLVFLLASAEAFACVGGTRVNQLCVSNYPNPFNPSTTVSYTVPSPGAVRVAVYDTRGALVKMLFEGDHAAGSYTIQWNGRDKSGAAVISGVYFARIEHNGAIKTGKMLVLK